MYISKSVCHRNLCFSIIVLYLRCLQRKASGPNRIPIISLLDALSFPFCTLKRRWLNKDCTFFYLALFFPPALCLYPVPFFSFSGPQVTNGHTRYLPSITQHLFCAASCQNNNCSPLVDSPPLPVGLVHCCLIPQRVAAEIYVCTQPTQVFKTVPREPAGCFTLCK